MKECDKPNSHISSKLHMICISSDNDRHPVTKTSCALHYTSPNYTSLRLSTLHFFPFELHLTTLHSASLHLSTLHFLPFELHPTTLNSASLHFSTLNFFPFKLHPTTLQPTSSHLNFTQLHFNPLLPV